MSEDRDPRDRSYHSSDIQGPDNSQQDLNPQLAEQVFWLFKDYLNSQLEAKDKQLQVQANIEKQATEFDFKGNRKQFELNSKLDHIINRIEVHIEDSSEIQNLTTEAKARIKKRQKIDKARRMVRIRFDLFRSNSTYSISQ